MSLTFSWCRLTPLRYRTVCGSRPSEMEGAITVYVCYCSQWNPASMGRPSWILPAQRHPTTCSFDRGRCCRWDLSSLSPVDISLNSPQGSVSQPSACRVTVYSHFRSSFSPRDALLQRRCAQGRILSGLGRRMRGILARCLQTAIRIQW